MTQPAAALTSCIYRGTVTHVRHVPKRHRLDYNIYMLFIELNTQHPEKVMENLWGWTSDDSKGTWCLPIPIVGRFSPRDYLSKEDVIKHLQMPDIARVFVLCNCRIFGFVFNPICVYYAYDAMWRLVGTVSEVHNTPWGERVVYVHDLRDQQDATSLTHRITKQMHVSPFFTMDYDYIMRFSRPGEKLQVTVTMEDRSGNKPFYANLNMQSVPLTQSSLLWTALRFPFMTFVVMILIYWHALLLWLKGVPFISHPAKKKKKKKDA